MTAGPFPLMLFAAGFGTRMKHLTADRPKPMVEVADRPMVDHALDLIAQVDARPVVANLHYKPDTLRAHLEASGVRCILEDPDILETGGGLRNALDLLGAGPVITMNPDAIWTGPNPLQRLIDEWDPNRMDALLMCVPPARTIGREGPDDFSADADGRLTRGAGLVYGGVQVIKTDLLAGIEERAFSLNVLWDKMLAEKRLFGLSHTGEWCDVGRPEGVTLAEAMLERNDV